MHLQGKVLSGAIALTAIVGGMSSPAMAADPPNWQLSTSATYESGTFGTVTRTDRLYVPFTLKRLFSAGDLGLTVPFVEIKTTGQTTLVNGAPQRISNGRRTNVAPTGTVTNSGLGDMILKGRYYVIDERDWLPTIALIGAIKFPTADENKGLGTGKFDEGLGLEISRTFFENFIAYFDVSYTFIGSPAGTDLNNQTLFDLGLGYKFAPQLLGSIFYEERTALVSGQPNPRSLLFNVNYKVTEAFRLNGTVEAGLSDGSPEYGLTAGVSVRF